MTRRRLEKWQRSPKLDGKRGRHSGVAPANLPWEIYHACNEGERINAVTLRALGRDMTLAEMYDLLEMQEVQQSYAHARSLNSETS